MPPGKVASQAGHAFLGAILNAQNQEYQFLQDYLQLSPGTKVCLSADLEAIQKVQFHAQRLGVPHFLVVDSGCKNFYDGKPTITALGIGPCPRHISKPVVGKLPLHN